MTKARDFVTRFLDTWYIEELGVQCAPKLHAEFDLLASQGPDQSPCRAMCAYRMAGAQLRGLRASVLVLSSTKPSTEYFGAASASCGVYVGVARSTGSMKLLL